MPIDAEVHFLKETDKELVVMVAGDESMANVAKKLYQKRRRFRMEPDLEYPKGDHVIVYIKTPYADLLDSFKQGYLWPTNE